MSSQSRLHTQVGCLAVADLADHDDVRILAQQCSQTRGESHTSFGIGLGLVDAGDLVFDWILDSRDINLRRV